MKKLISIICALLILLTLLLLITQLTACDATAVEREEISSTSMFVVVEETYDWTVVYHRQTKVMYVYSNIRRHAAGTNSAFTVMLDADGMPLLWRGE